MTVGTGVAAGGGGSGTSVRDVSVSSHRFVVVPSGDVPTSAQSNGSASAGSLAPSTTTLPCVDIVAFLKFDGAVVSAYTALPALPTKSTYGSPQTPLLSVPTRPIT